MQPEHKEEQPSAEDVRTDVAESWIEYHCGSNAQWENGNHYEYIYQKIDLYVWLSNHRSRGISDPPKEGNYLDFSAVCLKCGKMKGSHVKEILPYMTGATTCEFVEDPIKTPMAKALYLFLGGFVPDKNDKRNR